MSFDADLEYQSALTDTPENAIQRVRRADAWYDARADQLDDTAVCALARFCTLSFTVQAVSQTACDLFSKLVHSEQLLNQRRPSALPTQTVFITVLEAAARALPQSSQPVLLDYLRFALAQQPNLAEAFQYRQFLKDCIAQKRGDLIYQLLSSTPDVVVSVFESPENLVAFLIRTARHTKDTQLLLHTLNTVNEGARFSQQRAACQALVCSEMTEYTQREINEILVSPNFVQICTNLQRCGASGRLLQMLAVAYCQESDYSKISTLSQLMLQQMSPQDPEVFVICVENLLHFHPEVRDLVVAKVFDHLKAPLPKLYGAEIIIILRVLFYDNVIEEFISKIKSADNEYGRQYALEEHKSLLEKMTPLKLKVIDIETFCAVLSSLVDLNEVQEVYNQEKIGKLNASQIIKFYEEFDKNQLVKPIIRNFLLHFSENGEFNEFFASLIRTVIQQQIPQQLVSKIPMIELSSPLEVDPQFLYVSLQTVLDLFQSTDISINQSFALRCLHMLLYCENSVQINKLMLILIKKLNSYPITVLERSLVDALIQLSDQYNDSEPIQDQLEFKSDDFMQLYAPKLDLTNHQVPNRSKIALETLIYAAFELSMSDDSWIRLMPSVLKLVIRALFGRNIALRIYVLQNLSNSQNQRVQQLISAPFLQQHPQDCEKFVLGIKYQIKLAALQQELLTSQTAFIKQAASKMVNGGQTTSQEVTQLVVPQSPYIQQFSSLIFPPSMFDGRQISIFESLLETIGTSPHLNQPTTYAEFYGLSELEKQPLQYRSPFLAVDSAYSFASLAEISIIIIGSLGYTADNADFQVKIDSQREGPGFAFCYSKFIKDKSVLFKYKPEEQIEWTFDVNIFQMLHHATQWLSKQIWAPSLIEDETQIILKDIFEFSQYLWLHCIDLQYKDDKFQSDLLILTCLLHKFSNGTFSNKVYYTKQITNLFLPALVNIISSYQPEFIVFLMFDFMNQVKKVINIDTLLQLCKNALKQNIMDINIEIKILELAIIALPQIKGLEQDIELVYKYHFVDDYLSPQHIKFLLLLKSQEMQFEKGVIFEYKQVDVLGRLLNLSRQEFSFDQYVSIKQFIASPSIENQQTEELVLEFIKSVQLALSQDHVNYNIIKCQMLALEHLLSKSEKFQHIVQNSISEVDQIKLHIKIDIQTVDQLVRNIEKINENEIVDMAPSCAKQIAFDINPEEALPYEKIQILRMVSKQAYPLDFEKQEEGQMYQTLESFMSQLNDNNLQNYQAIGSIISFVFNSQKFGEEVLELLSKYFVLLKDQCDVRKYISFQAFKNYKAKINKIKAGIEDKFFLEILLINIYSNQLFGDYFIEKVPKFLHISKAITYIISRQIILNDSMQFYLVSVMSQMGSKKDNLIEEVKRISPSHIDTFLVLYMLHNKSDDLLQQIITIREHQLMKLNVSTLCKLLGVLIQYQCQHSSIKSIIHTLIQKILLGPNIIEINHGFKQLLLLTTSLLDHHIQEKSVNFEILSDIVTILNTIYNFCFEQHKIMFNEDTSLIFALIRTISQASELMTEQYQQKQIVSILIAVYLKFLSKCPMIFDEVLLSNLLQKEILIKIKIKTYVGDKLIQSESNIGQFLAQNLQQISIDASSLVVNALARIGVAIESDFLQFITPKLLIQQQISTQHLAIIQLYRTKVVQRLVCLAIQFFENCCYLQCLSSFLSASKCSDSAMEKQSFSSNLFLSTIQIQDSHSQFDIAQQELGLRVKQFIADSQEFLWLSQCMITSQSMREMAGILGFIFAYVSNAPLCVVEVCKVMDHYGPIDQFSAAFCIFLDQTGLLFQHFADFEKQLSYYINERQYKEFLQTVIEPRLSALLIPPFLKPFQDRVKQHSSRLKSKTDLYKDQQVNIVFQSSTERVEKTIFMTIQLAQDYESEKLLLLELIELQTPNCFNISAQLLLGYVRCIIETQKSARFDKCEDLFKKLQVNLSQQCNAVAFQLSGLPIMRSRLRFPLEELIVQPELAISKLSGFVVRIENCCNQLLQYVSDQQLWTNWIQQKKSALSPQEVQEQARQFARDTTSAIQEVGRVFNQECDQLIPIHVPFAELFEFLHWTLTQSVMRQNRLAHVSAIVMLLLVSSARLVKYDINDYDKIRFVLRLLSLSQDLAAETYISIVQKVFDNRSYSAPERTEIIECTHSQGIHAACERNGQQLQLQKCMLSILLAPQLTNHTIRQQFSSVIAKALLNVDVLPFDNYMLIMLADHYQQKPFSSDITKLGHIQQVKMMFQNNKDRGLVKRWSYQLGHHTPAVATQYQMNYSVCYDTQGIENISLIQKLFDAGPPHAELNQFLAFQQKQPKSSTRNGELKVLVDSISSVLNLLKQQQEFDIQQTMDLTKLVCYDLITKTERTEAAWQQLLGDNSIEQGALGAIYYELYLLLVLCYSQLFSSIMKQQQSKPSEVLRQSIEEGRRQLEEADKRVAQAERQSKKLSADIKEVEKNMMELFFKQDTLMKQAGEASERDQQNLDFELKQLRKKSESLHTEQATQQREVDSQNSAKTRQMYVLVKQIVGILDQTNQKTGVYDASRKFLDLYSYFERFYRFSAEQHQIVNQLFLNEKIAQRILCQLYEERGEGEAAFGLMYPIQVKQFENKQFVYSTSGKKLFEVGALENRPYKPTVLVGKTHDCLQRYNITFDPASFQERQVELTMITKFRTRPSFLWLGMAGDALAYVLQQCLLKSNPSSEYYTVLHNQLVGMHQDAINRMQKAELTRDQSSQTLANEITAHLSELPRKQVKKIVNQIIKAIAKNDQAQQKALLLVKFAPMFESLPHLEQVSKEVDKQEQIKGQIIQHEREAFQNLMYEKLIQSLMASNQFKDLDAAAKDMRDEYIKKQFKPQTVQTPFVVQITRFKLFMDRMTKRAKELRTEDQRAGDLLEWLSKFTQAIDGNETEEQRVRLMNYQMVCQIVPILNTVFPGKFQELHNIFIPNSALFSSVFNSIYENDESKAENDKLAELYSRYYSSPKVEPEMEFSPPLLRKIFEAFSVFCALYPQLGPELILKQGILRRSVGESLVAEKRAEDKRTQRLNGGDFSALAFLLLFQIQEYTPSAAAPGSNLIFFDKARSAEQSSMVKELEMVSFEEYAKTCAEISQYYLKQVSQLVGQEAAVRMTGVIENSYQSDAAMAQYNPETVANFINFAMLNFFENEILIKKLILLLRDLIVAGNGRRSLFSAPLVFVQYQIFKQTYELLGVLYRQAKETATQKPQEIESGATASIFTQQIVTMMNSWSQDFGGQPLRTQTTVAQLKLTLVAAAQNLFQSHTFDPDHVVLEKLFQSLRQELQGIRFQTVSDLVNAAMVQGDSISAQKLGEDYTIQQWYAGEIKLDHKPWSDQIRNRVIQLIQAYLLQGNLKQALTYADQFVKEPQRHSYLNEVKLIRQVIEVIQAELAFTSVQTANYQSLFESHRQNPQAVYFISNCLEDQLDNALQTDYGKCLQANLAKADSEWSTCRCNLYRHAVNTLDLLLYQAIQNGVQAPECVRRLVDYLTLQPKFMRMNLIQDDALKQLVAEYKASGFDQNSTWGAHIWDSYAQRARLLKPEVAASTFKQLAVSLCFGQTEGYSKVFMIKVMLRALECEPRRPELLSYFNKLYQSLPDQKTKFNELVNMNEQDAPKNLAQRTAHKKLERLEQLALNKIFAGFVVKQAPQDTSGFNELFNQVDLSDKAWLLACFKKHRQKLQCGEHVDQKEYSFLLEQIDDSRLSQQVLEKSTLLEAKVLGLLVKVTEDVVIGSTKHQSRSAVTKITPVKRQQATMFAAQTAKLVFVDGLPIVQIDIRNRQEQRSILLLKKPQSAQIQQLIRFCFDIKDFTSFHLFDQQMQMSQQIVGLTPDFTPIDAPDYYAKIFKQQLVLHQLSDIDASTFCHDHTALFNFKKHLCEDIAALMLNQELFFGLQMMLFRKTVDLHSARFISFQLVNQLPLSQQQQNEHTIHVLHISNELLHQSIQQKSDEVHTSLVIIDKYALEFLGFQVAVGYISTALGKALKNMGVDAQVTRGLYTKRSLVYDMTQASACNVLGEFQQCVYAQQIGILQQQAEMFQFEQLEKENVRTQLQLLQANLCKIIELLGDKTDERKMMKVYGASGLAQQFIAMMKLQMPGAVDWVVYAIAAFYE